MKVRMSKARAASTGAAGAVVAVLVQHSGSAATEPDSFLYWIGVALLGAVIGLGFAAIVNRDWR